MENEKTFKEWLLAYEGQDNCFGQLASVLWHTNGLPSGDTLSAYHSFFTKKHASKGLLDTLYLAWKFYDNPKLLASAPKMPFSRWIALAKKENSDFEALASYIGAATPAAAPSEFYYYYRLMTSSSDTVLNYFKTTESAVAMLRRAWSAYDPRTVLIDNNDYNIGDSLVVNLPSRIWSEGWHGDLQNVSIIINDVYPWGASFIINREEVRVSYRVCRATRLVTPNNNNEWNEVKNYTVATGIC